jgi:superfamily II DNA helicase RecQ
VAAVAAPGVEVHLAGGFTGRVVEVADGHAAVALTAPVTGGDGDAHELLHVTFGSPVTVDGRATTLVAPPKRGGTGRAGAAGARAARAGAAGGRGRAGGTGGDPRLVEVEDVEPELYEALRSWRTRVAAEHGVPAYLVFHDRHLQMIAARRPSDLGELAACQGVGPAKLERYGDDVLDLVAAHVGA